MKIGIDARMYSTSFTGIGRYVFELVQNLAKLDRENEYVCFLNSPEFEKFRPPAANFRGVGVAARHYSLAEQTGFLFALRREKCDLVHFTNFNAPFFYRGRTIVTIHDLTLSFFPGRKTAGAVHRLAYNLVLRRSVARARRVIAVSENTQKDLTGLLHTPVSKIRVISNGVGTEFQPTTNLVKTRQEIEKRFGVCGDFLLYAGVWRDHKNLLGLLAALAILRREKNFAGSLVITGRPDPIYAPAVHAAVQKLQLGNAVVFTGLVSEKDLLQFFQTARAFVFPSFYEGFGLPPLEAMACGVPVAASNTSSIPEVCGEGNALFFNPRKSQEIVNQIWRVWSDESLRVKLRERGFIRARDFRWKKTARETLAVYRAVLAKN